jgi:hypothetical protein
LQGQAAQQENQGHISKIAVVRAFLHPNSSLQSIIVAESDVMIVTGEDAIV